MNSDSVSCAVSELTPSSRARVGCAGRLMSIDSAATAVSAASVTIQRVEPMAAANRVTAPSSHASAFHLANALLPFGSQLIGRLPLRPARVTLGRMSSEIQTFPLGMPWQTLDPFLFCVHHD